MFVGVAYECCLLPSMRNSYDYACFNIQHAVISEK